VDTMSTSGSCALGPKYCSTVLWKPSSICGQQPGFKAHAPTCPEFLFLYVQLFPADSQ
jgi:hypothetical protein